MVWTQVRAFSARLQFHAHDLGFTEVLLLGRVAPEAVEPAKNRVFRGGGRDADFCYQPGMSHLVISFNLGLWISWRKSVDEAKRRDGLDECPKRIGL